MTLLSSPVSMMEVDELMGVKMDFIERYRNDAILVGLACDFPPIILLVQAALETGWGRHMVGNNLFGIKDVPWIPGSVEASTTEYDGEWKVETHSFEAFDSTLQSMLAYIVKISKDDRYREAWNARKNPVEYFEALQDAGYATDPDYSKKLARIYETFPEWNHEATQED
jgi:flagellar protein FlgJ